MIKIASFDVFDTVLTRSVGSAQSVFLLLGRRLNELSLIRCTPEAFARARFDAARRAARNRGGPDSNVNLRRIYAELTMTLGLTEEQCNQMMNLECALEEELIRPVPGVKSRIQAARANSQRVVFLSDMYLPAEFIQKQLAYHGFWEDGDSCYVSCEYAKSKKSGELFRELIQREGISSNSVSHHGNHLRADIQAAQRIGLRVEPFFGANLNRYEQILDSHAWATEGLSSAMAGASRLARLAVSVSSSKQEALRDIAASVVAPMLVGYVLWVLHRARQLGLKRLYFISRDGQILLGIARRLVGKLNISCELRYLYGSRRSWLLPAITHIDEEQLSLLHDYSVSPNVQNLLSRLDIEPEEISESLYSIGLPEKSWSRNLRHNERQPLFTLLREDARVRKLILQKAAARRPLMLRYLKQEGLLDPIAWGMVDVGWRGRPQNAVGRVLAAEGGTPPVSFSFGLRKGLLIDRCYVQQEVYFFNEPLGLGFIDLFPHQGVVILLDVFCSADHGQVVGYEQKGDFVYPILNGDLNHQLLDSGLRLLQETVYCFTEKLLLDSNLINVEANLSTAIAEVLKAFWLRPSDLEARAFADFPCEIGVSEDTQPVRLAEGYRWKHVVKAFWTAQKHLDRLILWDEGARAITAPHKRFALRIAILISRTGRRLLRPIKRAIRMFLITQR
jgi:FMN phosphatase YigB (HAD superfamily)